ncbi:MAG TPA: hypothetical protein VFG86_21570 [Chloroflexota bacterium]|jgi:hypothetical protein|nr:hypothetical protein [Chloroflexota bacterium]
MSATLRPISHDAAGQPRTFRLQRQVRRQVAYRRLAISILGLDVETLASELRAARLGRRDQVEGGAELPSAA